MPAFAMLVGASIAKTYESMTSGPVAGYRVETCFESRKYPGGETVGEASEAWELNNTPLSHDHG